MIPECIHLERGTLPFFPYIQSPYSIQSTHPETSQPLILKYTPRRQIWEIFSHLLVWHPVIKPFISATKVVSCLACSPSGNRLLSSKKNGWVKASEHPLTMFYVQIRCRMYPSSLVPKAITHLRTRPSWHLQATKRKQNLPPKMCFFDILFFHGLKV